MLAGKNQKQAIVKLITIIPLVICLIVIVFLVINVLSREKASQPEVQPTNEENKVETNPLQKPVAENKTVAENRIDVEEIKMDIITGRREDVPDSLNMASRTIIRDYLYACSITDDLNTKLECFELYYLNNDASLMQQKNDCEALSGAEKTTCLDEYYFKMGVTERASFCEAITDAELRNECLSTAV